jgi:ribosomal protein RSM22 (predicted rRNA methylase)
MELSLNNILPHLIYSFKSEAELVTSIQEISQKFTVKRENISDYLHDPKLVAAYAAFYLLTNVPKLEEVLKWMPSHWISSLKECDFIDLGAGPGTFSLAWKMLGGHGIFYQVETSPLMREQAAKIWQGFSNEKLYQSSKWDFQTERPKFLLFGHSANEMKIESVLSYIQAVNPEHILFIEPGTKEFFSKMLGIRDLLLRKNYQILYPCPNHQQCPLATSDKDWCHQYIHVRQHEEVERLSQMARKDRRLLPLTVHAYSRSQVENEVSTRVIRVLPETKFSYEWQVCQNNEMQHYQIMKRGLTKEEMKEIESVLSGTSIEADLIKVVNQTQRVKILKIRKP